MIKVMNIIDFSAIPRDTTKYLVSVYYYSLFLSAIDLILQVIIKPSPISFESATILVFVLIYLSFYCGMTKLRESGLYMIIGM